MGKKIVRKIFISATGQNDGKKIDEDSILIERICGTEKVGTIKGMVEKYVDIDMLSRRL